jgi:hypothetical protein
LAKWLDVDGCAFNASAWFLSGKTAKRSDSSVLIRYDVESELWISINPPNRFLPRNSHTFTLCSEHIYLLVGAAPKEKLNDVWRYDAIADTWTKPDRPARSSVAAKAIRASAPATCFTLSARDLHALVPVAD